MLLSLERCVASLALLRSFSVAAMVALLCIFATTAAIEKLRSSTRGATQRPNDKSVQEIKATNSNKKTGSLSYILLFECKNHLIKQLILKELAKVLLFENIQALIGIGLSAILHKSLD